MDCACRLIDFKDCQMAKVNWNCRRCRRGPGIKSADYNTQAGSLVAQGGKLPSGVSSSHRFVVAAVSRLNEIERRLKFNWNTKEILNKTIKPIVWEGVTKKPKLWVNSPTHTNHIPIRLLLSKPNKESAVVRRQIQICFPSRIASPAQSAGKCCKNNNCSYNFVCRPGR